MRGKLYLGRYEVQKLLGEGGMGKVYLARQIDLNRSVVLKVMHEHVAADPKFQERFQRDKDDALLGDYAELLLGYGLLAEGSELHDAVRFNQLVANLMVRSL